MGDVLCGPSNPLQSIRKQTQLDRTLQQDRLVGPRSSAAQGFRSYDPRTGSLDADLYAFEHNTPNAASLQLQQPPPSQAAFPPIAGAVGWAADFQKLRISQTSTPVSLASPHQQNTSGWGSEFATHFQGQRLSTPMADIKGKQVMQEPPLQGAIYNTSAYNGPMYQPQMQPTYEHLSHHATAPSMHAPELQISDRDFEAAFQSALEQASQMDQQSTDLLPSGEQEYYNANGFEIDAPISKQAPIGSDAIKYVEQSDRTVDQDTKDADELARTAGQLLTLVQHDDSEKMKNSQFLGLMRKIRDREVEVQENDFHSTINTSNLGAGMGDGGIYVENETDFLNQQQYNGDNSKSAPTPQLSEPRTHPTDTITDNHPNIFTTSDANFNFHFPDMNEVYADEGELYSSHDDEYPNTNPGTTTTYSEIPRAPRSQIQALHPGGKMYPWQTHGDGDGGDDRMSGAVATGLMNTGIGIAPASSSHAAGREISAEDFEGGREESVGLRRFAA